MWIKKVQRVTLSTAIQPDLTLRTIYGDEKSQWLYCWQLFYARPSGALASDFAQSGTGIKTLMRAWVGGCLLTRLATSSLGGDCLSLLWYYLLWQTFGGTWKEGSERERDNHHLRTGSNRCNFRGTPHAWHGLRKNSGFDTEDLVKKTLQPFPQVSILNITLVYVSLHL